MGNISDSTIEELEKTLTTAHDNEDTAEDVIGRKSVDCSPNSLEVPYNQNVKCLVCQNEFDRNDVATDPINLFCSLCKSSIASFPKFGETSSHSEKNACISPMDVEKENDEEHIFFRTNIGNIDVNIPEISDDEEKDSMETLPTHEGIYQQDEMSGYTGFQDAIQLGTHFAAAKLAGDNSTQSLIIGNLHSLVFAQSRDPNNLAVTGKQSFWKLVTDPYTRATSLIMYGYDLYDAWQFGDIAFVSYCMVVGTNGPLGYILFKMGRTRCASPRVDGFLYDIREDK